MRRFQEILVLATAEPETPEVIMRAAQLAERNHARLTLFDVVPRLRARRDRVSRGGTTVDLQELLIESRRSELEELASRVLSVDTRVDVAAGVPFVSVIERVLEFDHDLVIAAPDRHGTGSGLRGATTTLHLLRKCPCPVWIDDPQVWARPDVAVAVGPPAADGETDTLNKTLIELGTSLAEIQGGAVHLIHAWRLEGENLMRNGRVHLPAIEVDALVEEERVAAAEGFEGLVAKFVPDDVTVHRHLAKGDPADTIGHIVDEVQPGVVVMGTLARSGLKGLIIGNTAERLLGSLEASVLAVKPPGFVSPISSPGTSPRSTSAVA